MHIIKSIASVRDAVSRLDWRVNLSTGFWGIQQYRIFVVQWTGRACFYREPIAANHYPGDGVRRRTLPASWTNRSRTTRILAPTETTFDFSSDLSSEALTDIDFFRDGGRLWVRIEGELLVLSKDLQRDKVGNTWVHEILEVLDDPQRNLEVNVCTEPYELSQEAWSSEILGKLRPPGRFVFEATIPAVPTAEESGRRALENLAKAQKALDSGTPDQVAFHAFKAGEAILQLGDLVEARYDAFTRKRLAEECSAILAVCNRERHDPKGPPPCPIDRPLARHLLLAMQSLVAVYLGSSGAS